MNIKERVYHFIEPSYEPGRIVDIGIISLILLNIIALVLETVEPIYNYNRAAFEIFEDISLVLFTIEYAVRLWAITAESRFSHPVTGRIRFVFTPLALIDLLAILPFFLPLFGVDMRFVRVVRVLRIFRVIKLARYSRALRLLGQVVAERKEELISIFFVLLTLLVISSSLMYFAEHDDQPEVFTSIPATMWWSIVTLTTVGYGDAFPITALGQTIAAIIAILGIGMFALPAGLLGAGFAEELEKRRTGEHASENKDEGSPRRCRHCGELVDGH